MRLFCSTSAFLWHAGQGGRGWRTDHWELAGRPAGQLATEISLHDTRAVRVEKPQLPDRPGHRCAARLVARPGGRQAQHCCGSAQMPPAQASRPSRTPAGAGRPSPAPSPGADQRCARNQTQNCGHTPCPGLLTSLLSTPAVATSPQYPARRAPTRPCPAGRRGPRSGQ
jgi:hypothetical protein